MRRPASQAVASDQRAGESVRTPARAISCEGCGALFTSRRLFQRFCRPACRPLAQRHRKAEQQAELLARLLPDDPGRAE